MKRPLAQQSPAAGQCLDAASRAVAAPSAASPFAGARPAPRMAARPARRGLVLIFVIVILVLLAVMVTAYLATVRIDAAPLDAAGIGGAVGAGGNGGLTNAATLDTELSNVSTTVKRTLINELFKTGVAADVNYRAPGYKPYDGFNAAAGHGGWLASSVPTDAGGGVPQWRFISHWLSVAPNNFFFDPRTISSGVNLHYGVTENAVPGSFAVSYNYPVATKHQSRTRLYPALNVGGTNHIAADADGDGVADAGLFYLSTDSTTDPAQPIYYLGAVRIIDNAAAVNVNTAWRRDHDTLLAGAGADTANHGFFLANVGLYELLAPAPPAGDNAAAEIARLTNARFGGAAAPNATVYQDNGAARADFTFDTWAESMDSQLARRLENPGKIAAAASYAAFLADNIAALRYHFVLINPDVNGTTLERTLLNSLLTSAANYVSNAAFIERMFRYYPAGDYVTWPAASVGGAPNLTRWFNDNFHADPATDPDTAPTLRPYLTAFNPVANAISRHYFNGALPAGMPAYSATLATKANVNTASFAVLWRAYWNVMCDDGSAEAAVPASATMFDSPLRGGTALSGRQTQLLRAAVAAVNTEDLRDPDWDVSSHTITLPADPAATFPARQVVVFGEEGQPWLTEILLQKEDPANDYVAIELHNPYSGWLMNLKNWKLASLDRTTLTLTAIHTFSNADTIPGGGYLVIQSAAAPPGGVTVPGSAIAEPNLANAIGKELVLLRPRRVDGTLSSGTDLEGGTYNEGANLADMVPVDQADLSVPPLDTVAAETLARWHYQRPTDKWRFVYPGPLAPAAAKVMTAFAKDGAVPSDGTLGSANTAGATGEVPDPFIIQVKNVDMPGPNPIQGTGNRFPFGGFARDGDILQVPYFGAYRISDPGGALQELTAPSFDTAYMKTAAAGQNIGRFCPDPGATDGYQWAAKLFDYVTAKPAPADDYLPNVNPLIYPAAPQAVSNASAAAPPNDDAENLIPSQGMINVNTAPWEVISMLPMVPSSVPNSAADNQAIAKAIVAYREANGPFKTLFELNKVNEFKTANANLVPATADPGIAWGDLSGNGAGGADGVTGDFEADYLILNRISNLATVRSDSFTCYIVVQAWQNQVVTTGTGHEMRMLEERRAAFILDRSGITQNPANYSGGVYDMTKLPANFTRDIQTR